MADSSNFDLHDLADNQTAGNGHADCSVKKLHANTGCPENADAFGMDEIHQAPENRRHQGKNQPGSATLGRVNRNLFPQTEALPVGLSDFLEHLGEISAALFLNQYR